MKDLGKSVRRVARENGIDLLRPSPDGSLSRVSDDNLQKMLAALGVEETGSASPDMPKCFLPPDLIDGPTWGISLQLYELRSARNWGIGDFADLWWICDMAGKLEADFVGLNPLHTGFLYDPGRCSPYEPSNRRFLNPLYIAVDEVGGFETTLPDTERVISELRSSSLVDYEAVATIKLNQLRAIWRSTRAADNPAFDAFVHGSGDGLHAHALFETLSRIMSEAGYGAGWTFWPAPYRIRTSSEVESIERAHADDIEFHKWLQWVAHVQLSEAKERCRQAGMRIGLYLDLAVGEALDGSATWSDGNLYVQGANIGNPPEPFAVNGQDWRLAALRPDRIAEGDPSSFRRLMTSSMHYAGAIRIDHAAAFSRLFLVPTDGAPADGAYVSYPIDDLLAELARASRENDCIVIGEDLGNVAAGLREELEAANVLSYRILSYEKSEEGFISPEAYPTIALACVSTHDHQTFNGWWLGADIDLRLEHGLVSAAMTKLHRKEREWERDKLLVAWDAAGVTTQPGSDDFGSEHDFTLAAYAYLAATPSMLLSVRLADLTDEERPTNIPGTDRTYPNWRPKSSAQVEMLGEMPMVKKIAALMHASRPRRQRGSDNI